MGRQKGALKISGLVGDHSYYHTEFGFIVRRKGGADKRRIAQDPAFERVREQNAEFGNCSAGGKLFRAALGQMLRNVKDGGIAGRVTKLMFGIMRCDTVSVKGDRRVSRGLATKEGRAMLRGTDMNPKAGLKKVVLKPVAVDPTSLDLKIDGLVPERDLKFKKGASHVRFKYLVARINFSKKDIKLSDVAVLELPLGKKPVNVLLSAANLPDGPGADLCVLQVEFLQRVSGKLYAFNDGKFDVVNVVEVG